MSRKKLMVLIGSILMCIKGVAPHDVYAVGNGVDFGFREGQVPQALNNNVFANSLDLTYHDCLHFTAPGSFTESGYLWVSSFQDVDSVVDSQINCFRPNGHHIYAKYTYQPEEGSQQDTCTPGKTRRNYGGDQADLQMVLDPAQNTVLSIMNCQVVVANNADDVPLGGANAIDEGQKTETNDLINGDFEIVFNNWAFSAAGQS